MTRALKDLKPALAPALLGARPPLTRWVPALALAVLAGHVLVNVISPYELHRDAFLYLAMGRHLRFWRMDFPPLIGVIAQVERGILGDSLVAIRLSSALSHAALVILAGLMARELRGGRFAQGLAALVVVLIPLFLRPGALFEPVTLDQLWWTVGLYALARMARRAPGDAAREWLLLGAVCGLGLLTKFSILFFGLSVLVATLLSDRRRDLATPWPWLAGALALAIGSPSVVGQILLGWPVLGQMDDLQSGQLERVTYAMFLREQAVMLGPWVALAAVGLVTLFGRRFRPFRVVGFACLVVFLLLMALHGKPYYVGPIYPALLAAGSVALERWTRTRRWPRGEAAPERSTAGTLGRPATARSVVPAWGRRVRAGTVAVAILVGIVLVPMGLPILPAATMARYARAMGITSLVTTNHGVVLPLPQDYADMTGWEAFADTVARVWRSLPPEDRAEAVLIANNYGEAGALDYYGPERGLPPAIAPVGSYWFFGAGEKPANVA